LAEGKTFKEELEVQKGPRMDSVTPADLAGQFKLSLQVRNRGNHVPLNFPIKLNDKIAAPGAGSNRGDGGPTAGSHDVPLVLTGQLNIQPEQLEGLMKNGAAAVNMRLGDRQIDPLKPTRRNHRPRGLYWKIYESTEFSSRRRGRRIGRRAERAGAERFQNGGHSGRRGLVCRRGRRAGAR